MALTITEALAEIKTITKRIESKRQFITQFVFRQDTLRDPLQNQGGSVAAIIAERQAVKDLEARIVRIRAAIQKANSDTKLTVGNVTQSIADWLVWRRDVSKGAQSFLASLRNAVNNVRQQATAKGLAVRPVGAEQGQPTDVVVNIDEKALADEIEAMETTLGTLDGQLSLKNATTLIEV